MRIFKNRLVLGIICLVLAFVIGFVLTPIITNLQTQPVDIVTVNPLESIKKGTLVTKDMIQISKVGSYGLPLDTTTKLDDIIGKYTTVDLLPSSYILKSAVTEDIGNNIKLETLNGEYIAISFTVPNLASSLSSQLLSGDIISIIATGEETYIPSELTYIEILNCTSSNAVDTEVKNSETKELISTITVFATPRQALKIAELDKTSSIHVALQYRGNDDNKKALLDLQKQSIKDVDVDVNTDVDNPTEDVNPTPKDDTQPKDTKKDDKESE